MPSPATTVAGWWVLVTSMEVWRVTATVSWAQSLEPWSSWAQASFWSEAGAEGDTVPVTVTVTTVPGPRSPRLQLTSWATVVQVPWVVVAPVGVTSAGTESVACTPVEVEGPPLATVTV